MMWARTQGFAAVGSTHFDSGANIRRWAPMNGQSFCCVLASLRGPGLNSGVFF